MRKIIASLDIGDTWIKLVVGEIVKNKLNILACVDTPSRGVKKGFIVNFESTTEALKEVFLKAEETIGLKTNKVLVNIPCNNTECFLSEGYTTITGDDSVVKNSDIIRALQSCVYNKIADNKELVTILPTKYLINDTDIVNNPLGMSAVKLNVKAVAVTVPKKNIASIAKCLEKINVQIVDIAIGPLGDYFEFKNKMMDEQIGAVVNIGSAKTEVSIFNKGRLTALEVIDMGGDIIDYDIGYIYKLNRRDSMYLKEKIALADKNLAQPSESCTFETKKEISYIMITGGTTEIAEIQNLIDEVFPKAIVGEVREIGARSNKFSTAVGLIKYYDSRLKLRNKDFSIYSIEEQEELSGLHKKVNISEDSILGKLFGYFFDN